MKKYTVIIEETIVDEFEVIAESEKEALEIVYQKYKQKEFVLEPGEVQYTQMAVVKPYRENMDWVKI